MKASKVQLTFNKYQDHAESTAVYPNLGRNIIYPTLGLTSEAGEFSGKLKKIIRDKFEFSSDAISTLTNFIRGNNKDEFVDELGDVLWYVTMCASELGVTLEEVAKKNVDKLKDRQNRGKLHGKGDKR